MHVAAGKRADPKGDHLANTGDFNKRHNAVNSRTADAVRATATAAVVIGDKEQAHLTKEFNEDHVVDIAEVGGNDETGADVLYETKVPSPLTAGVRSGCSRGRWPCRC